MYKCKLLLWGTGDRTKKLLEKGVFEQCHILGLVDNNRKTECFMGYKVYVPDMVKELCEQVDYLVILNQYYSEILNQCLKMGIPWEKLVISDNVRDALLGERYEVLKQISWEAHEYLKNERMSIAKNNLSDETDEERYIGKGKYAQLKYTEDYFRYRTFEFVAKEIKRNKINGALAELGVFQGMFSSLINDSFPERKLYLFDTFEGFNEEEGQKELEQGRCNQSFLKSHTDTSVERMLANIPHPEMCEICKGYFPESISESAKQETYAFVSIDVDFEESTYQGLEFFYPRLTEGGYIFIHDYTTHWLEGVRCAVERYEEKMKIRLKKVPLADRGGTLVIVK